jgi:hypothetical protein
MTLKIGILSDSHGWIHPDIISFNIRKFKVCVIITPNSSEWLSEHAECLFFDDITRMNDLVAGVH